VAQSRDATALLALIAGAGVVAATAGTGLADLAALARRSWGGAHAPVEIVGAAAWVAARVAAPPLVAALCAALAAGLLQTRGLFVPGALSPRLRFGLRFSAWEAVRGLVLALLTTAVLAWLLRPLLLGLLVLHRATPGRLLGAFGALVAELARPMLAMLAVVALLDLLFRRWSWRRRQSMTVPEVRREQRESEGDPWIAEQRRRAHRELLTGPGDGT
jgi:flagellar biosynthetic protein FlhB